MNLPLFVPARDIRRAKGSRKSRKQARKSVHADNLRAAARNLAKKEQ